MSLRSSKSYTEIARVGCSSTCTKIDIGCNWICTESFKNHRNDIRETNFKIDRIKIIALFRSLIKKKVN
jgi:hypothetical protein